MNASIALALLGLAQLGLAFLADRMVGPVDKPMFARQLAEYQPYKIKEFFTDSAGEQVGEARVSVVLRMALLTSAARSTIVALIVCLVGLGVTAVVVLSADIAPPFEALRLAASGAGWLAILTVLILLFVRVTTGKLRPNPASGDPTSITETVAGYGKRLKDGKYLTRYMTVAFVGNTIVIVTALGL